MTSWEVKGGFELVKTSQAADIAAKVHLFRHEKTGAELVWLERSDRNKTFAIAFKTIPEDDTGVFHILEHSVLCGSDKYPVKEPFVELLKGSLNTFLNAMTFPDKTVYPVSSRNDADFLNLMRVYLDAVFCPAIYKNENIFMQEGWHQELDESGEPRCVGVVFGEMTGVFSSVDKVISAGMHRLLFPDSCYGFVYGGDPEHIPELTYERFIDTHRRFYHPSNARVFLDGDVDIESVLTELDSAYFSRYERRDPDFEIKPQVPLPYRESRVSYAVRPGEDTARSAHFVMGSIAGDWRDAERNLALYVLKDYLTGSNSAPLTRAVLERGLGQDLRFELETDMAQSVAMLQVRNTSEEKLPGLRREIQRIAARLVERGLDKEELTASLNRLEFESSARREPYGVQLCILALKSWLYGGDPALYLNPSAAFSSLRAKLCTGYFEDLLSELFLPEKGLAILNVLPSETLEAESASRQRERLRSALEDMGEDGRRRLAEKSQALALWHQTPDSAAALASIPHISVKDIPTEPMLTRVEETEVNGVRVLRPVVDAQKTVYLDLYFALPGELEELLQAASIMTGLLAELPTRRHTSEALRRAVKTHMGELSFAIEAYSRPGESGLCTPYFRASASVLETELDEAIALLGEILTETDFDCPDKLKELAKQRYLSLQQNIIMEGHSFAARHAMAGQTAEGAVLELTGGYSYYDWLRGVCAGFDAAFPELFAALGELRCAFTASNLTLSVSGNVDAGQINLLCGHFPSGVKKPAGLSLERLSPTHDAIVIPSAVGYAAKAADLYRVCGKVSGSMTLAARLLSLEHLWHTVRVQGGAYGAGMALTPNGSVYAYSYRDPNPSHTLEIFDGAAEYLRRRIEGGAALEQLIIGAISDSEPLRSAHDEALSAVARVLRGITEEEKREQRRQLLGSTCAELLECSRILSEVQKYSSTCVVAGEALITACGQNIKKRFSI